MTFALQHDIGAWLGHAPAINHTAQTASATDAAITGITYDRHAARNRYHSATAIILARGTITSGFSLAVAAQVQDSANDSDWSNYGDALASSVVLNAVGGPAVDDNVATIKHTVDLANARRYIRVVVTPTLSQTQTSTGIFNAVWVFGGAQELPPDAISPVLNATP